jgi:hypothetical protein
MMKCCDCVSIVKVFFGHKMNGTGRPEFAVDIRVTAFQAFLAQIDAVLQTNITGLPVRVVDTSAHGFLLFNDGLKE